MNSKIICKRPLGSSVAPKNCAQNCGPNYINHAHGDGVWPSLELKAVLPSADKISGAQDDHRNIEAVCGVRHCITAIEDGGVESEEKKRGDRNGEKGGVKGTEE